MKDRLRLGVVVRFFKATSETQLNQSIEDGPLVDYPPTHPPPPTRGNSGPPPGPLVQLCVAFLLSFVRCCSCCVLGALRGGEPHPLPRGWGTRSVLKHSWERVWVFRFGPRGCNKTKTKKRFLGLGPARSEGFKAPGRPLGALRGPSQNIWEPPEGLRDLRHTKATNPMNL